MNSKLYLLLPSVLIVSVSLSSCKKAEIEYYEIPKEAPAQEVAAEMPANHPPVAANASDGSSMGALPGFSAPKNQTELDWSVPQSWVAGAESSMRIASYGIEGVSKSQFDVSVTRFPGDVGGLFSNVNRWRGQLGLERYTDTAQVEADAERVTTDAFELSLFKMENNATPAMAMEVAILERNGFSWFFKMTGEKSIVTQESERFGSFIRSIQPGVGES